MDRGLTGAAGDGYPVVDIRVTLLDGKAHSVDSSDFAFQMAGAAALRDAAAAGRVRLLEPIDDVTVLVPDELIGAVMGDLSSRRARVVGTDKVGSDRTCVKAEVPQTELIRYAVDLRSLTHGSGSFTRGFARYEPLSGSSGSSGSVAAHTGAIA
jgi:elongation factor G